MRIAALALLCGIAWLTGGSVADTGFDELEDLCARAGDKVSLAATAVVAQRDPDCDDPGPADLYEVGCAASLVKLVKTGKDNFSVVVRGLARVQIQDYSQ